MTRVTIPSPKMRWIYDKGTEGSCFVWTIENFSYCLQNPGEYLDSPGFVLQDYETDTWRLRLYPRGTNESASEDSKTVGIRLWIEKHPDSPKKAEFTLSIQTTNGLFKKQGDSKFDFSRCEARGRQIFLKKMDLEGKDDGIFPNNDTLTLRCRIWRLNSSSLPLLQCHMRTIINVERTTSTWSLEKLRQNTPFDELTTILPTSLQMQSLIAVKLLSCRESFSRESIKLEIKQIDKDKPFFLTCDLVLFEDCGKVVHSMREEHMFDASEAFQVWTIPYAPPRKISDFKKTFLSCELAVSCGIENSWVERFGTGEADAPQQARSNLKKEQNFADSWKDDLERFYSSGVFTDFIIRTPSKEFPVHKAILCARSTVFHTMFEQDMKENGTGVVVIDDIDADIIHKMLLFAYSDVVEDLDCDVASKLYSAANKYKITALRRRCSDFLKENLSVSNVCKVLVLANVQQSEELKSFVLDFMVEHAAEVMHSVEWETFMQDQVPLASEIMNMLLLQNSSRWESVFSKGVADFIF